MLGRFNANLRGLAYDPTGDPKECYMNYLKRLHELHQSTPLTEIHMLLRQTGMIDVSLPTLRSWFYEQRSPSPLNLARLNKALDMIRVKPKIITAAFRVTLDDPARIYTKGTRDGTITILGEQIEIVNWMVNKRSNPTLFRNLHRFLSKYPAKWLMVV